LVCSPTCGFRRFSKYSTHAFNISSLFPVISPFFFLQKVVLG
jgi:hypothetical protein